jgi:hypothetical protein
MSDAERKRLRLKKTFRHYKKQERQRLSREELLGYLRERKIRSCTVLEKTRKPTEPNTNDFRREFGSWTEAVQLALGSEIAVDVDGDYVLKAVWELNLWSVVDFRRARKLDPVTIPSWRQVQKGWGTYNNLFECARRHNLKRLWEEYQKLIRQLGHMPSLEEIRNANLRMDDLIEFYGGKKKLDDFVLSMKGKL